MVATFDFPKVDMENTITYVFRREWKFGNETTLSLNNDVLAARLDDLGYGSVHMSENLGSVFLIIMFIFVAMILIYFSSLFGGFCRHTKVGKVLRKYYSKMWLFLHWNFSIRLVLQEAIILSYCCDLNIRFGSFQTWASGLNYIVSIGFAIVLLSSPILILVWYNL